MDRSQKDPQTQKIKQQIAKALALILGQTPQILKAHQRFMDADLSAGDFVMGVSEYEREFVHDPLLRATAVLMLQKRGFTIMASQLEKLEPLSRKDSEQVIRVLLFGKDSYCVMVAVYLSESPCEFSVEFQQHVLPEAMYEWLDPKEKIFSSGPEVPKVNRWGSTPRGKA